MMLFSSYQGNTPIFRDHGAIKRGNYITVQATLDNAFNDDFKSILQSGQDISILFEVELSNSSTTEILYFEHIVTFDPLLENWSLNCEEQNRKYSTDDWNEFIATASYFNYAGNNYMDLPMTVKMEASLPKIHLGQDNKEFDLMIFWNYHNPDYMIEID